ncbi:UNVERIFIED_CONTAM: hypothetical protein Sradi_0771400 [Sesamum radiatum]|uniref:Uncharacterized protein n=1 Tax=Sesamum radiatum TaxID=300843 RepID=A0AAW2VNW9_SESRA
MEQVKLHPMNKPCSMRSHATHEQASPPLHVEPPPPGVPPQEAMIQLTQEALLILIHNVSTRVATQPMAQFTAQHLVNPPLPSPRRSRELSSALEEKAQRQEEVNSRVSRPEVAKTQEQHPLNCSNLLSPSLQGEWRILICYWSSLLHNEVSCDLAEALPPGVKVSDLPEYDGTGDPQEHLDKLYAKIDWYDLSDTAYCKVFRTTLSKYVLAWFKPTARRNYLQPRVVDSTFFASILHEQESAKKRPHICLPFVREKMSR